MAVANPTAVLGKSTELREPDSQILFLAETSAVESTQDLSGQLRPERLSGGLVRRFSKGWAEPFMSNDFLLYVDGGLAVSLVRDTWLERRLGPAAGRSSVPVGSLRSFPVRCEVFLALLRNPLNRTPYLYPVSGTFCMPLCRYMRC